MKSRRQEKVARVIKEAVSDCLLNHLSDPRIEGIVSVTKVDVAADLRSAEVYISVLGKNETAEKKTFNAIDHAGKRIQVFLAQQIKSKFCPVLHFRNDENFKKTLETMRLIDIANAKYHEEEYQDDETEDFTETDDNIDE